MLHLVINTHDADSCAFRSEENKEVLLTGFSRMAEVAKAYDARVEGTWINMASHHAFILLDAPNAHVVDDIIRECGLIGHTDNRVLAVTEMGAAIEKVSD